MKIEEQVLSREQMDHLKELGVDTYDASMMWYCCDKKKWYLQINNDLSQGVANVMNRDDLFVPAYTIGDLIEKLPKSENIGELLIEFGNSDLGYGDWDCSEFYCSELYGINGQQNFKDKPLKDALYNLLCWVAENHKELIE